MSRLQIRWQSVGRAAAIAAAVIAGIVSLPALLGSDKPPPIPPDVGLRPAPGTSAPTAVTQPTPIPGPSPPTEPKQAPGNRHKLAKRGRHQRHPHPHRKRPHRRHQQHTQQPEARPAPVAAPNYAPPVYSYVPPQPAPSEFGIER